MEKVKQDDGGGGGGVPKGLHEDAAINALLDMPESLNQGLTVKRTMTRTGARISAHIKEEVSENSIIDDLKPKINLMKEESDEEVAISDKDNFDSCYPYRRSKPVYTKKEKEESAKSDSSPALDDGDFPDEPAWLLVGRSTLHFRLADFTPEELDTRKRKLNLQEMDPPTTLTCTLHPYQKQDLYWMSESEKRNDEVEAAKTIHPCWAAYRITDKLGVFADFVFKLGLGSSFSFTHSSREIDRLNGLSLKSLSLTRISDRLATMSLFSNKTANDVCR
ncbi:LOW QUALITY PROTEIN: hypothetical protein Scep_009917 [Stephania cephalantha]|uniref:Uncharacterized protein n=1 Tax=Stephania cephalantha TaxID=152367 RepID=A0AAP0JUG7_9MAGN